ncbi:MAG: hydroxymethylglutaryl-CoA lyase [Pseudorhodobacter sp.]|nr:hydroxymethylglutaryl-CoA lyase [Frankiaceae bacterium]
MSLPTTVTVYEVGARDGLQNEKALVPVEVKAEFVRRLLAAGHTAVETTSFVSPRWVPQLADAAELLDLLGPAADGVRMPVLVPNAKGLDRALAAGVREIAVFGSATETFARKNLNCSVEESLEMFRPVVERALAEGLAVRGYLSMCFGDPWEGAVAATTVAGHARTLFDMGIGELSLGDTIGVATPGQVVALLEALAQQGITVDQLAVHFHDTYGQALANTLVALQHGITVVDASAGGLVPGPYPESSTGNLPPEDLLCQLDGLGIDTGVDLRALARTSLWMAEQLGRPSPSRAVQALSKELA